MNNNLNNTLQIFSAGVAMDVAGDVIAKWNGLHPKLPAKLTVTGSVDLIRRVKAGERCDVLIVADDTIIGDMLMPGYAKGYITFGGNKIVLIANKGHEISDDDWIEKMTDPDTHFAHKDPYGDPGGYRSVMSMMLADNVQPGLSDKLLNHPNRLEMGKNQKAEDFDHIMYSFGYRSFATHRKENFAELPPQMDFSDDSLADLYATAKFAVDENNTVAGAPISHGVTIPLAAKYPEEAKEFVKLFLKTDFESYGFVAKEQKVYGENIM